MTQLANRYDERNANAIARRAERRARYENARRRYAHDARAERDAMIEGIDVGEADRVVMAFLDTIARAVR